MFKKEPIGDHQHERDAWWVMYHIQQELINSLKQQRIQRYQNKAKHQQAAKQT